MNRQKLLSKERIKIAFNTFDKNRSGTISKSELKDMLGQLGNYDEELWDDLI
jgi:Ca2+-binding EF-hand superfamily protein